MNHIYIEGDEDVTGLPKTFRLDRAENIEIIADLNKRVTPDLKKINSEQVKLFVSKEAQSFLNINSAIISESHLLADGYEVLIDNVSEKWLISEVFGYGGEVRVLAPERIAKNISEIATKRLGGI
jgi:predicted DNA-binding transcriptional regulator YafY